MNNRHHASPPSVGDLTPDNLFRLSFAQCFDLWKLFPDFEFRLSAALALTLGWLITSKDAQRFISDHAKVAHLGTAIVAATIMVLYILWSTQHYLRARACHEELTRLANRLQISAPALLESVRLDWSLPVSYGVVNALICGAIVVLVWQL